MAELSDSGASKLVPQPRNPEAGQRLVMPRTFSWTGLGFVLVALALALFTFLVFSGLTPVPPNNSNVQWLILANLAMIFALLALVVAEALRLYRQWRAQAAGAALHLRVVALFTIVAATPALLMVMVGTITLHRSLNPGYMHDVSTAIHNTGIAAKLVQDSECGSLLRETRLTAADLDRGKALFDKDPKVFNDYFASRARFLGFATAVMMKTDGEIIAHGDAPGARPAVTPEASDFADAAKNDPSCLLLDNGDVYVALSPLQAFKGVFLYTARPISPLAVKFPQESQSLEQLFQVFEASKGQIQLAFGILFGLLALIMLLSATWIGLAFANQLVAPIRRLIAATDQVASGNLYVQVPVRKADGDLGHLGQTFNKMTSELRLQQNRLLAASQSLDDRRQFIEAVLAGVPTAIIGVDDNGLVNVVNDSALKMLGVEASQAVGRGIGAIMPELTPLLESADATTARLVRGQAVIMRGGHERKLNIHIGGRVGLMRRMVVTLDDITDLVSAQRTAAWADVARRIAHEIKNPLTPIQLSAERLKRKYGRLIVADRDIFDQCTDTIIRQVDDIKRMVDEFSSFARMPKSKLEPGEINSTIAQAVFLMRNGNPDISIESDIPDQPVICQFDRRLIAQALTNIIKNATEGLATAREQGVLDRSPRILVRLHTIAAGLAFIDIIDNGVGFPTANRNALLEPYVTTRAEGTGLGLPIVAKIMEDHGGGIELLDAPEGQGARVALFLPLMPDAAQHDEPSSQTPANPDAAPPLLLPTREPQ